MEWKVLRAGNPDVEREHLNKILKDIRAAVSGSSSSTAASLTLSGYTTDDLTEGSRQYYTDERVDDRVFTLLTAGTGITLTYDDLNDTLTIDGSVGVTDHGALTGLADDDHTQYHTDGRALTWLGTRSTTDLAEGTNLYYTNARADARVAAAIGSTVQGYDAHLAQIAALSPTTSNFIMGNGVSWILATPATARTNLGLGTLALQNASAVTISGGTIDGTGIGVFTPSIGNFTSMAGDDLTLSGALLAGADIQSNGTYYVGDGKNIVQFSDTWLRLNPTGSFTSGIYLGAGLTRSDGTFQVGSTATAGLYATTTTFNYQGNTVWHAGNHGLGSGLDADTVRGMYPTDINTGSTVVSRDANGDFAGRYITSTFLNMTHGVGTRSSDTTFYSSTDNYLRKNNATGMRNSLDVYSTAEVDALITTPTVGFYAPTLTNVTNVASSSPRTTRYIRIGDMVWVYGYVQINPSALGQVELGMSLPIASNFTSVYDCGGTAAAATLDTQAVAIRADTANDRASFFFNCSNAGTIEYHFSFMYIVI